jgi:hypothetical protein
MENHHTVDFAIGVASTFVFLNPAGALIFGAYFFVDLGVQLYTKKSITEHIFE